MQNHQATRLRRPGVGSTRRHEYRGHRDALHRHVHDVEQDLHAKLAGRVTIHVGKRQLEQFAPHPSRAADGSVRWSIAEGEPGPLQSGQRVLAALLYVKSQKVWSLMGDMLSAVDDDEVIHTPRGGCLSRPEGARSEEPFHCHRATQRVRRGAAQHWSARTAFEAAPVVGRRCGLAPCKLRGRGVAAA
jgi:hypothetical protein